MSDETTGAVSAPTPPGESGDTTTEADAGAVSEPAIPKSQVEKLIASRVAKMRGEVERLKRELDAARTAKVEAEPDVGDANAWRQRMQQMRAEAEVERHELLAQLEAARKAHDRTRIEHAVLAEAAKRGDVRDVPLVLKLIADDLEVADDGTVRAKDSVDGLPEYLDGWLKTHTVFLSPPPRGDGLRVGGSAAAPTRSVADAGELETYRMAAQRLMGRAAK